jgi:hypothetical protein
MSSGSYISKYFCYVITYNRKQCQLCLTVVVLFTRRATPAELEQETQETEEPAVDKEECLHSKVSPGIIGQYRGDLGRKRFDENVAILQQDAATTAINEFDGHTAPANFIEFMLPVFTLSAKVAPRNPYFSSARRQDLYHKIRIKCLGCDGRSRG